MNFKYSLLDAITFKEKKIVQAQKFVIINHGVETYLLYKY